MAEITVSSFGEDNCSTTVSNEVDDTASTISLLYDVITRVILVMGIPGNILSAIVWLRRRVASKNSSALYLAALAIDDLVYLLITLIFNDIACEKDWVGQCAFYLYLQESAGTLEPLLVLGFSVERLIAILRPLQVC